MNVMRIGCGTHRSSVLGGICVGRKQLRVFRIGTFAASNPLKGLHALGFAFGLGCFGYSCSSCIGAVVLS